MYSTINNPRILIGMRKENGKITYPKMSKKVSLLPSLNQLLFFCSYYQAIAMWGCNSSGDTLKTKPPEAYKVGK